VTETTDKPPIKKKRRRRVARTEPPTHPLWGIVLLGMILGWMTFSLWINAAKFDSTEGKAIGLVAGPLIAGWSFWFWRYYHPK
jgi:hypothetical protein